MRKWWPFWYPKWDLKPICCQLQLRNAENAETTIFVTYSRVDAPSKILDFELKISPKLVPKQDPKQDPHPKAYFGGFPAFGAVPRSLTSGF